MGNPESSFKEDGVPYYFRHLPRFLSMRLRESSSGASCATPARSPPVLSSSSLRCSASEDGPHDDDDDGHDDGQGGQQQQHDAAHGDDDEQQGQRQEQDRLAVAVNCNKVDRTIPSYYVQNCFLFYGTLTPT